MTLIRLSLGILAVSAGAAAIGAGFAHHDSDSGEMPTAIAESIVPPTRVGMNLSPIGYWSGERPFVDPVKSNSQFDIQLPGTGPAVPLIDQVPTDINGFPKLVPKGTVVLVALREFKPAETGRFDCVTSPGWSVVGVEDASVFQKGRQFRLTLTIGRWAVSKLKLTAEKDGASLSELACSSLDPVAGQQLFNPALLDDLRPFGVIRFMNWMRANNNPPSSWAARPTPQTRSQAESRGVALEYMVSLAAQLGADPWFTVPLRADDEYYRNFAMYVRDYLPVDRQVYIEVSNEVWNAGFPQSKEATRLGQIIYPSANLIEATDYYYADRVRKVMSIWKEVFGTDMKRRVVRVLSSQAVYPQRAENSLRHRDTWRSVDAVAIAPYFGEGIQVISATGDARLRELAAKGPAYVDKAIASARASKAVAAKFGLPLIAYEAGPDFAGYNPVAVADSEKWRASPELASLYKSYLDRWQREIGGLIVLYDSAGKDAFGHKLYTGQPIAEAPLMRTALDFANSTHRQSIEGN